MRRTKSNRSRERLERAWRKSRAALRRLPAPTWFERDHHARLDRDVAMLHEAGYFGLDKKIRGREAVLAGTITVAPGTSGVVHTIDVLIRYPDDYPRDEPSAYLADPQRFNAHDGKSLADRHLSPDGWCCLWLRPLSPWSGSDDRAIISFVQQFTVFLEKQLIYDVIGRWPGKAWSHGLHGYAEYVCEVLMDVASIDLFESVLRGNAPHRRGPCPCGSEMTYVACHKGRFDNLKRQIPNKLSELAKQPKSLRELAQWDETATEVIPSSEGTRSA